MDFKKVSEHKSADSCWIVLYGNVYNVTSFLPQHPGGSKAILRLAGQDATDAYDPIHPPGILEDYLPKSANLGPLDKSTISLSRAKSNEAVSSDTTDHTYSDTCNVASLALLNLDDVEKAARQRLSKSAWAYYYSAADDLISKALNNSVYARILMRPRVLVDCTECSTTTTMLGYQVGLPLFVSPAAMARLAHESGEKGIAQACSKFGAVQIISNNASMTPEQIVADAPRNQIFGWQLYVQMDREKSEKMLARINRLPAIKFVVLTLDAPVPGKREDDERSKDAEGDSIVQSALKIAVGTGEGKPPPGLQTGGGIGKSLFAGTAPDLTWEKTLPWLLEHTSLPIVLKGVQTHEDAYLASQFQPQVRGIILSNHGGRALDTAPPAVHTLMEIRRYCPSVFKTLEVYVDGGIRRGTDIIKALCLGAHGVGIGRPALWGLAACGQGGVERVLEILAGEMQTCMRLLGVSSVQHLAMHHINARAVEYDILPYGGGILERIGLWVQARRMRSRL